MNIEDFPQARIDDMAMIENELKSLGFHFLADIAREECVTHKDKNTAPIRIMLSSCKQVTAHFSSYKLSGFFGVIVAIFTRKRSSRIIEFSTRTVNDYEIITTMGEIDVKSVNMPNTNREYVAEGNSISNMYSWHQRRVTERSNLFPSDQVKEENSKEDLFAMIMKDTDLLRSAYAHTGYQLTKAEIKQLQKLKHQQKGRIITDEMLAKPLEQPSAASLPPPLPRSPAVTEDDGLKWFHTCKGEQIGPSSLAEVKEKISNGEIKTIDLAWNNTMEDWLPITAIPQLKIEKNENSVYTPSPASLAASEVAEPIDATGYDSRNQPGIKRLGFWMVGIPALLIDIFSYDIAELIGGALSGNVIGWIGWIAFVIAIGSRIKNLAMHSAWFWVILVPFYNLWLLYRLCCCPSGYAEHKKLGKTGIWLTVIYWLGVAAAIIMLVLAAIGFFWSDEMIEALESGQFDHLDAEEE